MTCVQITMNLLVVSVVSTLGQATAAGSSLVMSPGTIDLGNVWIGESCAVLADIRNEGSDVLSLEDPKANCSCGQWRLTNKRIAPGDHAELRGMIVPKSPGNFSYRILLRSNKEQENALVTVTGHARNRLVFSCMWDQYRDQKKYTYSSIEAMLAQSAYSSWLPELSEDQDKSLYLEIGVLRKESVFFSLEESEIIPLSIQSSLFKVKEYGIYRDKSFIPEVRVWALLIPEGELTAGPYRDTLFVDLGHGLRLSCPVRFTINSHVWACPSCVYADSAAGDSVVSLKTTVYCSETSDVWENIEVHDVFPRVYRESVSLHSVSISHVRKAAQVEVRADLSACVNAGRPHTMSKSISPREADRYANISIVLSSRDKSRERVTVYLSGVTTRSAKGSY